MLLSTMKYNPTPTPIVANWFTPVVQKLALPFSYSSPSRYLGVAECTLKMNKGFKVNISLFSSHTSANHS